MTVTLKNLSVDNECKCQILCLNNKLFTTQALPQTQSLRRESNLKLLSLKTKRSAFLFTFLFGVTSQFVLDPPLIR